ncbi:MAG: Vms1/Ankzf1 family peptidyl-tRNA hydrolase [Salinigranum sp.]
MFDELLGRAELKARIEELEEENRHLERRCEAEAERRSEAVSERQEAEERNNRLEDRIADLEGRVERLGGDGRDLEFRGREDLRDGRLSEVLARLRSVETAPEGALTALVDGDDGDVPETVAEALGDRASLLRRVGPCLVCTDDAGVVAVALEPPFPPDPFATWADEFRFEEEWFRPTAGLAVALVRSDLFVLGEYDGVEWTLLETLDSDVKSAHKKGGFSQRRFERIRDEQVAAHVERSLDRLAEHDPDRLVCVGERTVLGEFRERATHTATVDASGDPEAAFDAAVRELFTTPLWLL